MHSLSGCRLVVLSVCLGILPALPANGAIVVSTVPQLVAAVNNTAGAGDRIILLADGIYHLDGQYLRIAVNGVTVRSQSGKREQVILDGNYKTTEIFQIVASDVTIADLTLKRARDHPIHVMGGSGSDVEHTLITNVHIIDPGEQAIKINTSGSYVAHFGTIRDSLIELTSAGRTFVENVIPTTAIPATPAALMPMAPPGGWCGIMKSAVSGAVTACPSMGSISGRTPPTLWLSVT